MRSLIISGNLGKILEGLNAVADIWLGQGQGIRSWMPIVSPCDTILRHPFSVNQPKTFSKGAFGADIHLTWPVSTRYKAAICSSKLSKMLKSFFWKLICLENNLIYLKMGKHFWNPRTAPRCNLISDTIFLKTYILSKHILKKKKLTYAS